MHPGTRTRIRACASIVLLLRPEYFWNMNCCAVLRKENSLIGLQVVTGFHFTGGRGNSLDPRNYSPLRPLPLLLASCRHHLISLLLVETHSSHVVSCMRSVPVVVFSSIVVQHYGSMLRWTRRVRRRRPAILFNFHPASCTTVIYNRSAVYVTYRLRLARRSSSYLTRACSC